MLPKQRHNFIINFKPSEIRDIREDILLYQQGYAFFYAVDIYDIVGHYMPYTDHQVFTGGQKNMLAQRCVAYEKFFTTFLTNRLVVMDQYMIELFAAKHHIERQIKNAFLVRNNMQQLKEEILQLRTSDQKKDKETLRANIELIVFLLILKENKKDIYHNFFDFLNTKLAINHFNTGQAERDRALQDIFDSCKPDRLEVEKIYDQFVQETVYYLSKLDNDYERYKYLENSYRDIEVINRLRTVNQLLNRQPELKTLFVYLSSAPYKSKKILSLFQNKGVREEADSLEGFSNYGFHRNIFQCFLYKVLIEEYPTVTDQMPLQILDALERLAIQTSEQKENEELLQQGFQELAVLNNILDRYSSNIDNHFYFDIYNKYHNHLELSGTADEDGIMAVLMEINNFLQEENILTEGQDISYNISQYEQTFWLSRILGDKRNNFSIHIPFGKDIIRDNFHHLPYLLFIHDLSNTIISQQLYPLFVTISNVAVDRLSHVNDITPFLRTIFESVSRDNATLPNTAMRLVLTTYLYLITETRSEEGLIAIEEREEEAIVALEKQRKLLQKASLRFAPDAELQRLAVVEKRIAILQEFDYLLLWLYRRNHYYAKAIELGNELVINFKDPRFYHGLALAYVSQAYDLLFNKKGSPGQLETSASLLENALTWLLRTREAYSELLQQVKDPYAHELICKSNMAVHNSLADISIRKYVVTGLVYSRYLEDARSFIEAIKRFSIAINIDYLKLAIYNYTEAELEYYEAEHAYHHKEESQALNKINAALERFQSARLIKSSMHEKFKEIEENIIELKKWISESVIMPNDNEPVVL